ncbi:transglutaminase domain-containing protein [Patescibacteria group bacterium]
MPEKKETAINLSSLDFYKEFGPFTFPGAYQSDLAKLPTSVQKIGSIVRMQLIPVAIWEMGNTKSNLNQQYGDMDKVPWYRQREDDNFPTAAAMLAELYRRDSRGLVLDREEKNCLVVSCRFTALLMAAILKSQGIPTRVRSGFAPYFEGHEGKNVDHWINEYWDETLRKWVLVDADVALEPYFKLDPFNLPRDSYYLPADVWVGVREERIDSQEFWSQAGYGGLSAISEALFYDFACLNNYEPVYAHYPAKFHGRFHQLFSGEWTEIDTLAGLMQFPDDNFAKLRGLWETSRAFRLLKGGLIR